MNVCVIPGANRSRKLRSVQNVSMVVVALVGMTPPAVGANNDSNSQVALADIRADRQDGLVPRALSNLIAVNKNGLAAYYAPGASSTPVSQDFTLKSNNENPNQKAYENSFNQADFSVKGAQTFDGAYDPKELKRLAGEGIKMVGHKGENYFDLEGGSVLFRPTNNIVVSTFNGDISISAGAAVAVTHMGSDVAIYHLAEDQIGDVIVYCGESELALKPGRVLVLTRRDINDFRMVESVCRNIKYKSASKVILDAPVDESMKAFTADFSIPSAIIAPLAKTLASGNQKEEIVIANILRNAVAPDDLIGATSDN